ncbi:MAG TPA: hypothetical protein VGJ94_17620 [Syntrophorhabdaceae bacterium]
MIRTLFSLFLCVAVATAQTRKLSMKLIPLGIAVAGMMVFCFFSFSAGEAADPLDKHDGNPIKKEINISKERELQTEVDKGHQPWRLNPVDAAFSEVGAGDRKVIHESCELVMQTSSEALVRCTGTHIYLVQLKQLVKPNGIWSTISIQVEKRNIR